MKLIHLSTPNSPVYTSIEEARKEMNALTIKLSRFCESNDVNNIRFEIVISNTSSHTHEEANIHIHALIYGEEYVATLANMVCDYISSRHSSVYNTEKNLRVYKVKHNNYEYLHEYLQKQARYQRAFERNFIYYNKNSEAITTINDVANTGNSDFDDYKKAIFIEEMQLILNQMKSECKFYQFFHFDDMNYTPELIDPATTDEIIDDYKQGKKTVCVYTPHKDISEIYADSTQNTDVNQIVNSGMEYNNSNYIDDTIEDCTNTENERGDQIQHILSAKEIATLRLIITKAPQIINIANMFMNFANQQQSTHMNGNPSDDYTKDFIPPF